jgi:ribulose kinase
MDALAKAIQAAVAVANVTGNDLAALAIDTTGSSVVPVDRSRLGSDWKTRERRLGEVRFLTVILGKQKRREGEPA